ncbi:methyl-accepting chemotaxis protein [Roseibium aggregatum]|uniref:methyl-accepting chemotaxis protein n=1 Tax=Roseibium aggregatum TaxID=187304 RepID=UPI001E30411C|nr:PAS domain-containing methyl-accepting chemotaxis protein [Roseibium aggregatum]UES42118.1 PAS domain S-box protein [Roseibium aggregatum]
MFSSRKAAEREAILAALDNVQAIISFTPSGKVLSANENFLNTLGYELDEIVGKHHSMFVENGQRDTAEYKKFWADLNKGEFQSGQFKRVGKNGKDVWIEASYNPILDRNGRPYKIVKFASDVSGRKARALDLQSQIDAIYKSQAVIEFALDGTILTANENFLKTLGYRLEEIKGKHHSMFVEPAYRASASYATFWKNLSEGTYQAGQYKRLGRNGLEVWIEASYNPILDLVGHPYKVVKFATDITEQIKLHDSLGILISKNFAEIDIAVQQSSNQATAAKRNADSTARTVETMAAASEELASTIAEIAQSMEKSREATTLAHDQVGTAASLTQKLSSAAVSMSGIVNLIQDIAGQINMLALNATIESARAGDAGRGFAVVAQEVKNLANQAANATNQIGTEIEGIQSISGDVAAALGTIENSMEAMRGMVVATASAVEEQSTVTRDLSANMQNVARAVGDFTGNVDSIDGAVTKVRSTVSSTRDAAEVLSK